MEVDVGGKLMLNYTSCGFMLMEVDWGGKLIVDPMVDLEVMKLTQLDTMSLKSTREAMIPVSTI